MAATIASRTHRQAASSSPRGPSHQSPLVALRRKVDRLEADPSVLLRDDVEVAAEALRALQQKANSLKPRDSNGVREVDELVLRIQRLTRSVNAQAAASTPYPYSHQSGQRRGTNSASTSAMGRFLEESIRQNPHSPVQIRLPPAPKLIVVPDEENAGESFEERARRVQEEEEDLAEYDRTAANANSLRRRKGHVAAGDEDDGGEGNDASEHAQQSPQSQQPGDNTYPPQPKDTEKSSKGPSSSAPDGSLLTSDRNTQEALSTELLRMAGVLKNQSVSFSSALERDRKLLESADEKLLQNLDIMTKTRGRLGEYAHKARGMGWFTLGTVIMVVVSWVVMFVVIRLT